MRPQAAERSLPVDNARILEESNAPVWLWLSVPIAILAIAAGIAALSLTAFTRKRRATGRHRDSLRISSTYSSPIRRS
jgi:hypothetical protein